MDLAEIIVTTGGVALMVLTLWFFFGKQEKAKGAAGKVTYSCPMHPWITSEDPTANCSICGMKLIRDEGVAKS